MAAEMLAGTTGIGFIENVARTVSDYELIWVTMLIMGMMGLFFDFVILGGHQHPDPVAGQRIIPQGNDTFERGSS